jgi:GGDEF domain-containing protein
MVFRIGGDEFMILVHNTNQRRSTEVAEKLRQEVEQTALLPDRQVTINHL